jgi:hypothetical protein
MVQGFTFLLVRLCHSKWWSLQYNTYIQYLQYNSEQFKKICKSLIKITVFKGMLKKLGSWANMMIQDQDFSLLNMVHAIQREILKKGIT